MFYARRSQLHGGLIVSHWKHWNDSNIKKINNGQLVLRDGGYKVVALAADETKLSVPVPVSGIL